jgi:hypothetical protein
LIKKIISGGQTGIDRAALDVALELGIPCGGWCPKGRLAEDGPIDLRYPLQEVGSTSYSVRTERNVMEADGTLILTEGPLTGGTALTLTLAQKNGEPHLVIDLSKDQDIAEIMSWVTSNEIEILNVAGRREGKNPGIHDKASRFLQPLFAELVVKNTPRPRLTTRPP